MLQISEEDKYKKLFNVLSRWVALNEKDIHIDQYFRDKKINKIAIQGFGRLGRHLLFELKKANILVEFGIDQRKEHIKEYFTVYNLSEIEQWPETDIIIVTAIADFYDIEKEICEKKNILVVSLEEVIGDMEIYAKSLN